MKKHFLSGCAAALFAALLSLSSCEPPVTNPDDGKGNSIPSFEQDPTGSNETENILDGKPSDMDSAWWVDVNVPIMEKFGTTTIIPEPKAGYLMSGCQYSNQGTNFTSGQFDVLFAPGTCSPKDYEAILKQAGFRIIKDGGGQEFWSDGDGKDYLIACSATEFFDRFTVWKRSDVLQEGQW